MTKRKLLLFAIDVLICLVSFSFMIFLAASELVSSLMIPSDTPVFNTAVSFLISAAFIFSFRFAFGIYKTIWRYAGVGTYLKIVCSDFFSGILIFLSGRMLPTYNIGFAVAVSFVAISCLLTLSARFAYQHWYAMIAATQDNREDEERDHRINIAIVGAGNIGASLASELLRNPRAHYKPVCFIDADSGKAGQTLNGIPVYSSKNVVERLSTLPVQEIVIALPELDGDKKADLFDVYKKTGCKVKLYDYPLSESGATESSRSLRDLKIEDLLFRENIDLSNKLSASFYKGKTVLVTGGGGSIGSELCRQIASLSPKKLVIFDIYENNAYDIEQELRRAYGKELCLEVYIGSVRDAARLDAVFGGVKPDVVLHAAAHKHVPLMESSPAEAVKNNILGTYNTALAAERHGVQKFVLISTDKAVNPTNVMGATKRFCEMIAGSRPGKTTSFAAVRFGNVLGSNGSVIPLFRKQIENGGPITITDRRIIRYFMTIPEAAGLVLEAGAMANHGELFVLEMGKPIKIWDLAVNMVTLAGLEVGRDIEIREVGLRPGEKLYEELLVKSEHITRTENSLIFIEKDAPLSEAEVARRMEMMCDAIPRGNEAVIAALKASVPTFMTPEEINSRAEATVREELGVNM